MEYYLPGTCELLVRCWWNIPAVIFVRRVIFISRSFIRICGKLAPTRLGDTDSDALGTGMRVLCVLLSTGYIRRWCDLRDDVLKGEQGVTTGCGCDFIIS